MDTLDAEKFQRLTRWGKLEDVWEGILAAEKAGLTPIKLNAVVVKGYNEDGRRRPGAAHARPSLADALHRDDALCRRDRCADRPGHHGRADPGDASKLRSASWNHPTTASWTAKRGSFTSRALRAMSASFHRSPLRSASSCTRARLTADGRLRLCLLRENEVDLLTPLRAGASLEDLRRLILDGIWSKPWGHGLAEGVIPLNRVMNEIGG